VHDDRATWLGAGIAVGGSLLFTVIAAALESTINPPGTRNVAPAVLWGLGGGLGLVLGAIVAAALTRRVRCGVIAALVGAVPFLILVVLGYNSNELKTSDKVVGTLIVLVLPALVAACVLALVAALVARLVDRLRASMA
jgi:hypothetical protein